jgi:hypothetical protein
VKYDEYALKECWIEDNRILLEVKEKPTYFHFNEELIDPKVEMLADSRLSISCLGHLLDEPFELE